MFIEAIEGSWADHPFWRNQFRLDRAKDVERLKSSHVTAVIIDTDKGVDVALPIAMTERSSAHPRENLSLKRALRTIEQSKPLITEIFENARIGGTIPVSHAAQAVEHIAACMQDSGKALIEVTRLKARDEYTFLHSIAVSGLVVHLARFVGLDEKMVRDLGTGAYFMTSGKFGSRSRCLTSPPHSTTWKWDKSDCIRHMATNFWPSKATCRGLSLTSAFTITKGSMAAAIPTAFSTNRLASPSALPRFATSTMH